VPTQYPRSLEPYSRFAAIYDRVMAGVNYAAWVDYLEQLLAGHGIRAGYFADLACGTGNVALELARRGCRVVGVDRSEPMLQIARQKARERGVRIPYLRQDLRHLRLPEPVDVAVCLYDSLNYLLTLEDFTQALTATRDALRPGGWFIFDLNSTHKLENIPEDTVFIEAADFALVWQNRWLPAERIWEATLTGFLLARQDPGPGLFERFKEVHLERAYEVSEVADALAAAGLRLAATYTAYTLEPVRDDASRIFFVAQAPPVRPV